MSTWAVGFEKLKVCLSPAELTDKDITRQGCPCPLKVNKSACYETVRLLLLSKLEVVHLLYDYNFPAFKRGNCYA